MATLLIVTSLPLIIMFILSGYWESVLFIGIGLVFSISILMAILKTAIMSPVYAVLMTFSSLMIFIIAASGAAAARAYLKGGLDTIVHSTIREGTDAYLIRSLTGGAIVVYFDLNELAFIPKEKIQYMSSVVKANRLFDVKYFWRTKVP
jgi:hypothetical protein